ncbi:MAG TPA: hypothetical protein VGF79_04455 [Bacteroidia bacterium]
MKRILNITFIFFLLNACSKDDNVQTAPSIKILGVSATDITEFTDSLVIDLEYTDGDGDIGESDPDKNSLYIKDRRLSEADYYFVKPLSPTGSEIKITGKISVKMKNTFLLGTGNTEVTRFDIKLRDRAGHWSNTTNTPEITIHRK